MLNEGTIHNMKLFANRVALARIFGGAVISQGLLSAINLLIGLILIRGAPPAQYAYYVLIASAAPLLVQLQNNLIAPNLNSHVNVAGDAQRKSYIGGLLHQQGKLMTLVVVVAVLACGLVCWVAGVRPALGFILLAGVLAAMGTLFRDSVRLILITYRRPYDVLQADVVYAVVFVGGVWLATLTSAPAAVAALAMGAGAVVGGLMVLRAVWRHDPWTTPGLPGAFTKSLRLGVWSATGAVIHWVFNQGYTYIVALRLDVTAVAAISATRLLLSPLGVFSLGIASLMFSTSTLWLKHHGARGLLRRVLMFAVLLACMSIAYIGVMWAMRDWIFLHILKRDYPQRDLLLGIWSAIFLCTVIRDQVIFLLVARGHFKRLAGLTACCASIGLAVTFTAIGPFGAAGGLLGLLAGEVAYVIGVGVLTFRDMRGELARPNDVPVPS
jgi:O-antigen/teichoic acid export membrane protein